MFSTILLFTTANVFASDKPVGTSLAVKKIVCKKSKKGQGYVVYVNNKQAIWLMKGSTDYSAKFRAEKIVDSLQKFVDQNNNPRLIRPVNHGRDVLIKAGNSVLVTADTANARALGVSTHELAYTWANEIRVALGAPKILKDYSSVSRGTYTLDFQRKYIGTKQSGLASWYGGRFNGRKTSDGSRFNTTEFTAAHKTLPFGTLVKVSNLHNGKSCVVKINDRGPFVHNRIIDLSKASASQIGVLSRGVANVQIEVIGKY
ncbi:MAG: septal ring lytic transglycosylase RlpA family protein [Candidatus Gastranaerophilaceae bacterium]